MATKKYFLGATGQVGVSESELVSLSEPTETLMNGVNMNFKRNMVLPLGYVSISSIELVIRSTKTGNLYLKFATSHVSQTTGSSPTEDVNTYTTYDGGDGDDSELIITVPAAAYNGLTSMVAYDRLNVAVYRDATNASDTYEGDLEVIGFYVNLTTGTVSAGTIAAADYAIVSIDRVKDFLGIPLVNDDVDDYIQDWINLESEMIESVAGVNNKVVQQTITGELRDGNDRYKIRPQFYPIELTTTIPQYLNSSSVWTDLETSIDYVHANNPDEWSEQDSYNIELDNNYFPSGTRNIKLTYKAGYSIVPTALIIVCIERVAEWYNNSYYKGSGASAGRGLFQLESISSSMGGSGGSTRYKDFSEKHTKLMKPYVRKQK